MHLPVSGEYTIGPHLADSKGAMTRAFFALPILFAAACSTSTTSTNDDLSAEDYDDTAQAISSAAAGDGNGGDLAAMSDSANIALGVVPLGFSLNGNGEING